MRNLAHTIRSRATYANVMATVAVFIALGGTGYAAATLPRNSVGSAQIRTGAVGATELKRSAVTSNAMRDRSIALRDLSLAVRNSLRGATGPAGPAGAAGAPAVSLFAAISSGGERVRGNATRSNHALGSNEYRVTFDRDVSVCVYSATLAAVQNGATLEQPPAGRITVAAEGTDVLVKTYDAAGTAAPSGFHLLVAC